MKKCLLILSVLLAFSCSKEEMNSEQSTEVLEVVNFSGAPIIISECSGYGIYQDQEYDCGWKIGYEDWVAHYNYVVESENHPECYKVLVVTYTYNGEERVTTKWQNVDNSYAIIQEAQNNNTTYYNNLYSDSNPSTRKLGQQDGYAAGRGQQPIVANDTPSCN